MAREAWEGKGRVKERKRERKYRERGREGSTWIFVLGRRVSSDATGSRQASRGRGSFIRGLRVSARGDVVLLVAKLRIGDVTMGLLSVKRCSALHFQARCFSHICKTTHGLHHSEFFISQLIDRADRKLFKQTQLSHHCLNSLLPSSRLPYSRYSLRSRRHQFSLPQLNTVLYKNMFVNRCLFLQYN